MRELTKNGIITMKLASTLEQKFIYICNKKGMSKSELLRYLLYKEVEEFEKLNWLVEFEDETDNNKGEVKIKKKK